MTNPNFLPGLQAVFSEWSKKGIKTVGDLVQEGSLLRFNQVKAKYGLTNKDFLKYFQIRSFIISKLKDCNGGFGVSYRITDVKKCSSKMFS